MANIIRSAGAKRVASIRAGDAALGGMKPDFNPADLAPTDFVNLENVRRVGGEVVSRGGQGEFVDLDGEATGMVDFQMADGARQLFVEAQPMVDAGGYFEYNRELSPKTQLRLSASMFDTALYRIPITPLSGPMYGQPQWPTRVHLEGSATPSIDGIVAALLPAEPAVIPPGSPAIATIGSQSVVHGVRQAADYTVPPSVLFTLPTDNNRAGVIQAGNFVYIYTEQAFVPVDVAAPRNVSIFQWDGITLRKEYDVTTTGIAAMEVHCVAFRDSPVFLVNGYMGPGGPSDTRLFFRSEAGVWSFLSIPVATPGFSTGGSMVSYRDRLYFRAGWAQDIFSFDGFTITQIPPATTGIPNIIYIGADHIFAAIMDLAVFNGALYYVWYVQDSSAFPPTTYPQFGVGKFDGTTWDAGHKDMWAQFPPYTDSTSLGLFPFMAAFGGHLIVSGAHHGAFLGGMLYHSPGIDTAGAWTEEDIELGPGSSISGLKVL